MEPDDDVPISAPPTVTAAVACGTVPLPFLGIYAVLFVVHGSVHPVVPPDITNSQSGELVAGIIALVVFVLCVAALLWALNGRRRWPFVATQAALLGGALWFLVDGSMGGEVASGVVAVASLAALVLALVPLSSRFYGRPARHTKAEPVSAPEMSDSA